MHAVSRRTRRGAVRNAHRMMQAVIVEGLGIAAFVLVLAAMSPNIWNQLSSVGILPSSSDPNKSNAKRAEPTTGTSFFSTSKQANETGQITGTSNGASTQPRSLLGSDMPHRNRVRVEYDRASGRLRIPRLPTGAQPIPQPIDPRFDPRYAANGNGAYAPNSFAQNPTIPFQAGSRSQVQFRMSDRIEPIPIERREASDFNEARMASRSGN
jgi:hypothetical protein